MKVGKFGRMSHQHYEAMALKITSWVSGRTSQQPYEAKELVGCEIPKMNKEMLLLESILFEAHDLKNYASNTPLDTT